MTQTMAVVQARMSSRRLPGKVLADIGGRPLLAHLIERLRRSRVDNITVATSTCDSDNAVARWCRDSGVDCFRGDLHDVLDRYYRAARRLQPEHLVRVTADCPLLDPQIVDRVVAEHLRAGWDYTSNVLPPTYPDGLDVEVFSYRCLRLAWQQARLPSEREHVTLYINQRPGEFAIGNVAGAVDLSHYRWTVDEVRDLDVVREIFRALYTRNPRFGLDDMVELMRRNPALARHNSCHGRNEGLQASLLKDAEHRGRRA